MKRQAILKSTLFLLMAMVCHVAWAQTTYVVSANTGKFNAGWASEWTYNTTTSNPAQLKLITTNGAGNMQGSGGEMYLYTGSAAEKTCTYRLSVELPYKIVGYSFKYQDKGSSRGKTITINGTQYTVDETVRNLGMSGINTRSTEFTLSGENERVTFTDFQVLIQTVPTVTMYYNYSYNGVTRSVACLAEVGESYPVPTLPYGLSTTTATPSGTVQNSDNGRTFAFACTSNIPFEYASSYSGITKWYYMQMHSNSKRYIEYMSNDNYLEWVDAQLPTSGSTDAYAWAFVGNPFDGFKLYNRQVGSSKAVASTGSGNASMTATGTTFTLWASKVTGNAGYFCLKTPSGNFLNAQNDKVNHWGDNDAGSTLLLSSAPLNVGEEFTLGSVTYCVTSSTNREVEVDDVSDAATSIDIPASVTYDGVTYNVTSIGNYAFDGCSSLTSITLPESVTSIGEWAFQYCSSLTSITIPEGVTSIGQGAFKDCSNLKTVINLSEVNAPAGSSGCGYLGYYATTLFNASTGELYLNENYNYNSWESYPWHAVRSQIKSVEFGSNVTSIGQSAFYGCSSLTSISLHDGVTSIGEWAFYNCPSLTSITLPEGVTSIGKWAFYNCSSLTNITIPKSVTSIGEHALGRCKMLTNVTIPEGVTSIEDYTFNECSSLTNINIPEGVTSIGQGTFYGCSSLTSITLPEGVTSIRELAFYECSSLTNITILESVTSIGEWAFSYCSSLTNITIPEGVTSVGQGAFEDCPNLKTVINLSEVNASVGSTDCGHLGYYATTLFNASTGELYLNENYNYNSWESYPWHSVRDQIKSVEFGSNVTSIGDWAFYNCSSLTSISIPEGVTSIGDVAFQNCSSLTNITIPEGVTSIEYGAFDGCSSLTSITLPEGVTSIGDWAFAHCSSLTNITIPESVTSIGTWAFRCCSSLTEITIPEGVTSIENGAFYGCSSLTEITIPEGVTSIENYTFEDCSSLTNITIPEGVTSIGGCAFDGCSSLTSITLPEGVTSIGDYAFNGCSSLTSITLPEGVTSIENNTFFDCSSLTSVTIPEGVTSIGDYAFSNCSSLTNITLPDGVTSIGDYAFSTCPSLTNITLPDGVTSIGEWAFIYCSSLTNITLPEGVTSIGEWAFSYCSSLTNITIPANVESIGTYAFNGCSSLKTIYNLSDLDIVAGSETHGNVAYYADIVYTPGVYLPEEMTMTVGDRITLSPIVVPEGQTVKWTSSNTTIAVVSNKGVVTAMASGYVAITATVGDHEAMCFITIAANEIPVTNITLNKTAATLIIGETLELNATITPADATNKTVKWSSSNTSVATVDNNGVVTPITDGTATITATAGNCTATCEVTVKGWTFDEATGKLYVNYDYDYGNTSSYPWHAVRGQVESVEFGSNVTSIGEWAFFECSSLANIAIPANVESIGELAFAYCSSLIEIIIPESVTSIGNNAFQDCSSLANVVLPNSVTTISASMFTNCSSLESITIPERVTVIDQYAFYGCSSLQSINIPSGVTSIGYRTFLYCSSLENITIPANVESIGEEAFYGCTALKTVTNLSDLNIDAGSETHGYVAYYAEKVWTRGVHLNETAIVVRKGEGYTLEATVITEDTNDKTVTWNPYNPDVATIANGVVTGNEVGTTIIEAWAAGDYATCNVTVYTPGDVNLDGMVLVDDIVLTINEVLTIDMENFLFEAADMDCDNQILVNDVTMVINTALGIDTYAAQRARSMARTTMTASQEGAQYSVSLSNATDYVAMQFDMMLPEGMNLDAIKMAEGNSHAVRYNLMENGAVRVVVASLGNEAFVANQLLSICVSGNDSEAIVLTNVCLSTREGELVQLDDAEIEIQRVSTHIQPEAQATATADIYDLNGRLVKKNATSTEGLDKGVYLMNGKKITVK